MREHFGELDKARLVFDNLQITLSNVHMAVPTGKGLSTVADYRTVKRLVAEFAMPKPRLKNHPASLGEAAAAFCPLCMIKGYWKTLLHLDMHEVFTTVIPDVLYTPKHFLQGALKATIYSQAGMGEILEGTIGR